MAETHNEARQSSDTVAVAADSPQISRIESLPAKVTCRIIDAILSRDDTDVALDLAGFVKSSPTLFAAFCAHLRTKDACRPLSQVFFVRYQKGPAPLASCEEIRAAWWEFWAQYRRARDLVYTPSEPPSLLKEVASKMPAAGVGLTNMFNVNEPRRLMRTLLIFGYISEWTWNTAGVKDREVKDRAARDISSRLTGPEVNDYQALWECVSYFYVDQITQHKILKSFEAPKQRGVPTRFVALITFKGFVRTLPLRGLSFLDEYIRAVPKVRRSMLIKTFGRGNNGMENPALPTLTEGLFDKVGRAAAEWM